MKIYISIAKESIKGLSYWVKFEREDENTIAVFHSYNLEYAITEADRWGRFFKVKVDLPPAYQELGLTQEMIDKTYNDFKDLDMNAIYGDEEYGVHL